MTELRPHEDPRPAVTLWLNVYQHRVSPHGAPVLWKRRMPTPFPPRKGDRVYLVYREGEADGFEPGQGEWDNSDEVRDVWFDGDGTYNVALRDLVVDPDPETEGLMMRDFRDERYRRLKWKSGNEGSHTELLTRSGWVTH